MSRKNLENPLWEHVQKQYARNPQGMKTIEDAVTWGGNVAGTSALAVGTAPIWLPYAATAANTLGKVGKQTLQGLDWLFNPTTYRGALLSSYVGAEGVDEFRKNPNVETGAQAALGLLPVVPVAINGARKGYRDIYNYGKDLAWLAKTYNKVGIGLKNPYVRSQFLDLAKNPSRSRNFIETYSSNGEANLTYSQIKKVEPYLKKLQEEFNITPTMEMWYQGTAAEQVNEIRKALLSAKNLSNRYVEELEFLKNKNKILYNIAKESPQYQQQIINDYKNGNITNVEEYVKNLIKQSNTFLRRMYLKPGQDFTEAFSTIRGYSLGHEDFSMDVGNPKVVFDPMYSRHYGNNVAVYSPKEIKLNGPVETWWSQRRPLFQDKSIYIEANGMHTNRNAELRNINAIYNNNKYLEQLGVPSSYGRTASHMIFLSPNKGASIADQFTITPGYQNIMYTLGYKNGGQFKNI